jgi:cytochrome c556
MNCARLFAAAAGSAGFLLTTWLSCVDAAAANPVEERQATMKQLGFAMRDAAPYANGKSAYDGQKVTEIMQALQASAKQLASLFPAGSDADPKTTADPKIWQNKADFDKRLEELVTAAAKASSAPTADEFKPLYATLGGDCKSCHDIYRQKR